MHKNDFFPFIFFSYHSFSLSYLELQIIFPCRDIGPATATLDPRPRHWTRDRDFGPATRDPRLLVKLIIHLQAPFRVGVLTRQMEISKEKMSAVRESVELLFADIIDYFKFRDFKKNLRIGLSQVGKICIVCAILRNALA